MALEMVRNRLPIRNEIALDLARLFVSPVLVPEHAWPTLRSTAAATPHGFGFGCIEARLTQGDDRIDLLFCASRYEHNREVLAETVARDGHGALRGISTLLDAWVTPGNVIHDQMPLLWVEVDHMDGSRRDAFGHVRIAPYVDRYPFPDPPTPLERWELAEAGIRAMSRGDADEVGLARLREICANPPHPSVLMHLNVAASRGTNAIRFEFSIPRNCVMTYLRSLDWRGNEESVERALALTADADAGHFAVLCALEGGVVAPHVSLEPVVGPADYRAAWGRIFAAAAADGCASPVKIRELEQWAGWDAVEHPDLGWPAVLERSFDFKFLVAEDGTIATKVYLVYHPRFRLTNWPKARFVVDPQRSR